MRIVICHVSRAVKIALHPLLLIRNLSVSSLTDKNCWLDKIGVADVKPDVNPSK